MWLIYALSGVIAEAPAVVVASQRMNDNPGWRPLRCGELLHVDEKLDVTSTIVIDEPPAQLLMRADLDPRAAASQSFPYGSD